MLEAAAIDVDAKPGESLRAQQGHRPQQHGDALVVVQQAEETETIARPGGRRQHGPDDAGALAVGHMTDPFARNAPVHVRLDHETAGAGEMVHLAQMMLASTSCGS